MKHALQADTATHPGPGYGKVKFFELAVKRLKYITIRFQPNRALIFQMEFVDGMENHEIKTGGRQIFGGGFQIKTGIKFGNIKTVGPDVPGEDQIFGNML